MENSRFVYLLLLTSVCGSSAFTVKEMSFAPETDGPHFRSELDTQWIDYIKTYNKSYSGEAEMLWRRHVWEKNVDTIQKHNVEAVFGAHTYTMGVNHFTDMTFSEFSDIYLSSQNIPKPQSDLATEYGPLKALPTSFDWRTKGAVTPIKNQGKCESCWAFSATGAVEGQWAIKKKQLVPLSEQNLIDCSRPYGNNGCSGGLRINAFKYITKEGIDKEKCYPYTGKEGKCRFNKSCVGATVRDYKTVPAGEKNLRQATVNQGPISAAIHATPKLVHYKSGVYSDPDCDKGDNYHALLVVGYAPGYWIIKNSWGTSWGIKGYLHLAMDKGDMCHVSQNAIYPIV